MIYCADVFHLLSPREQIKVFKTLYSYLKPEGVLYFIQSSVHDATWGRQKVFKDPSQYLVGFSNEYAKKLKAGDLWPGYDISCDVFSTCMQRNIDIPTLHGEKSLKDLLDAVGFEVVSCEQFTESFLDREALPNARIGAIANKKSTKSENTRKLVAYVMSATEKEAKIGGLIKNFQSCKKAMEDDLRRKEALEEVLRKSREFLDSMD